MPNPAAAQLIAQRLPNGLMHPGDGDKQPPKMIPLPGLAHSGIPREQAAHFANEAGFPANDTPTLIAEAIVHLLETDGGLELIDRGELAALRTSVAAPAEVEPAAPLISLHCPHRSLPLICIPSSRAKVTIDCRTLAQLLAEKCS